MKITLYIFLLSISFAGAFKIHSLFLTQTDMFLIKSYFANALLAIIALTLLAYAIKKKKSNLALVYLLTVAIKLIVYFLFFYPEFKTDGIVLQKEFFIFFIPYALGLLAEISLLTSRFS